MLRHNAHCVHVSAEVRKDLLWWSSFIRIFNWWSTLIDQCPIKCVFTDDCDEGAEGSFNWSYDWPQAASFHINEKRSYCGCTGSLLEGPFLAEQLLVYSDYFVTVSALNKGTCRNDELMRCIRSLVCLSWLSARYNFHLSASHIQGVLS